MKSYFLTIPNCYGREKTRRYQERKLRKADIVIIVVLLCILGAVVTFGAIGIKIYSQRAASPEMQVIRETVSDRAKVSGSSCVWL